MSRSDCGERPILDHCSSMFLECIDPVGSVLEPQLDWNTIDDKGSHYIVLPSHCATIQSMRT